MAQDFRASQFRGAKFIASGSSAGGAKLVFYHISADSSIAPNQGNINQLMFNTSSIGTDVFMYVSGTVTTGSSTDRITVFGGSTKVSGVLGFSDTVWLEKDQNASLKFFDEANPAGLSLSELYGISELDITVTDGDTVVNVEPAVDGQALYLKGKGSDSFGGTAGIAFLQGGRGYVAANGGDTYVEGGTTVAATQGKVRLANIYGSEVIISRTGTPVTVSGSTKFEAGLSGSLTNLVDGSSYLVAGANTTITTQSNGSIVIASTGGGGGGSGGSLQNAYVSGAIITLNTSTGSVVIAGDPGTTGSCLVLAPSHTSERALSIMNNLNTRELIGLFGLDTVNGGGTISLRSNGGSNGIIGWEDGSAQLQNGATNKEAYLMYNDTSNELEITNTQPGGKISFVNSPVFGGNLIVTENSYGSTDGQVYLLPNKSTGRVSNSGSLAQSGSAIFYNGLSGSLTKLKDGSSYLIAGTGVTVTTGTNGAITIGASSSPQWVEANPGGPALRTTASVAIGSGASFAHNIGADVWFYVSGAIESKSTATRGTATFGGDLHVSGNLTFGGGFRNVSAINGNATLTVSDRVINADAGFSNFLIGLPNPALIQPGLGLLIKKTDTGTNTISLTQFASEQIEGTAATFLLPGSAGTGRPAWMVYSDGTNWWVV